MRRSKVLEERRRRVSPEARDSVDIAVIGKNGTKMLKKELFDAHLYVHLDGITSLLPYYYVKLKREVEL